MAIVTAMPQLAIIDGFKDVVDFYYWMGIPCARKWPNSPGHIRTPAVMEGWLPFTYAAKEWNNLSLEIQAAYNEWSTNSGLSGRDMFTRSYMTGLYRYPIP